MTDITIPKEALEAAKAAYLAELETGTDPVEAACLAMLRAWPGVWVGPFELGAGEMIILPLTENSDAR